MLPGNGTSTWADAHLTKTGISQAHNARSFWISSLSNPAIKIPAPESFYVSPLDRCLATAQFTFTGGRIDELLPTPFVPTVKELLREALGIHTCDRRSSRSYIAQNFPDYKIEAGFAEEDPWWDPELRESDSHLRWRMKQLLDEIFSTDDSMFVSLTSHSGAITQILEAVRHRRFELQTGGVIPVLVRAERIQGKEPEFVIEPGSPAPSCPAHLVGTIVPLLPN
jgi:broad specificity phosphatase PhoE